MNIVSIPCFVLTLSLFSFFHQNSENILDEGKLNGRLKEYFLDAKVLAENPEIKKISQILNIDSIRTRSKLPNNTEIFLELLKPLDESEKSIFRSLINENALVYILGNYKGGLLDSKKTADFFKQVEIIFLNPNWKIVNQSDKSKLINNAREIIDRPEMAQLKTELKKSSIDLAKLNIGNDGIFINSTKVDASSPEVIKLKKSLKEILEKASSGDKTVFDNKNMKDFISLKDVTLLPVQNTPPEIFSAENIRSKIYDFFNDPSNKDLINSLEKQNADPSGITFGENEIIVPLKKKNSEEENDLVKVIVREGLDFFIGNYKGGANPSEKVFVSRIIILIQEPNFAPQSPLNFEWSQVTLMQPIMSFYSQGCFLRKKYVPVIFFIPVTYYVMIQRDKDFLVNVHPQTAKASPLLTTEISPDMDAENAFHFGKNEYQNRNLGKALEYFNHSISKDPVKSIAWHYRAVVLFDLGQNEKAQYSAKRAGSLFLTYKDRDQTLVSLERIQGVQRRFLVENRESLQKDEIVSLVNSELPPEIKERKKKVELAINKTGPK